MAKQTIGIGAAANDGTGDTLRTAMDKCNDNFDELYDLDESGQTDDYTLALTDNLKLVTVTKGTAVTLTVPANASVAFGVGSVITIAQGGVGQLTIAGADGVTINSYESANKLVGQYAVATLIKTATNTWLLAGNIEA
ncbi:MAG TPA: hypothetical protein VMW32_00720 [Bacteroidales bacterium]|nr:hypothetical protein [Bacteroidales bacterium]